MGVRVFVLMAALVSLAVLTVAPEALPDRSGRPAGRRHHGGPPSPPDFVRGQLVVKYRDSVRSCVHCLLAAREGLAEATAVGGEELQSLHERFHVRTARPVFRSVDEERRAFPESVVVPVSELRRLHLLRQLSVLDRFPRRSARVGPGASLPELHHVYVLELPRGLRPLGVAAAFARDPNVEYAHPNYLARATYEPDDPYFHCAGSWGQSEDDLWGLKHGQLDMEPAWDVTRGEGVVVAVVDTGIDHRHEDLAANIWSNPGEVANGADDDDNGFVDDVRGWDFTTCARFGARGCLQPKPRDADSRDDHFHGTHVAGTVAAVGDNGRGIVGVAPRASVMAVKALNGQGIGTSDDLAAAIVYAASNGADVLNNSWGCGFCPSIPVEEDAVRTANGLGAVVVFAAGNSSSDSRVRSPQNMRRPKPIVVAASDPADRPTFFTNFGAAVDVAAPGGGDRPNILSLKKGGGCAGGCGGNGVGGQYLRLFGTSMSSPHAAGLAALVLARQPTLRPDQVRQVLRGSSDDVEEPGFDLRSGAGRLDAARAVSSPTPLEVEITAPAGDSAKRGRKVGIRGTARGPGFVEARLFAAAEGGGDWTPLGGPWTTPFSNRDLARAVLRPGWNLLRLEATASDGRRYEDVVSFGRESRHRRIAEELPGLAQTPDVSAGRIVWLQVDEPLRKQIGHVYLYDRRAHRLVRLTAEPGHYLQPRISGDRVVWRRAPPGSASQSELLTCVFDDAAGECPVERVTTGVDTSGSDRPVVSGDLVVFEQGLSLVALDLATGTQRVLTSQREEGAVAGYDVDGDRIVWSQLPLSSRDDGRLRLFDWSSETTETIATGYRIYGVAISGTHVAYQKQLQSNRPSGLHSIDLASGMERVLEEVHQRRLDASRGRVVWAESSDIRLYDLAAGAGHAAVLHPLVVRATPALSGRELVWIRVVDTEWAAGDVYYARLR